MEAVDLVADRHFWPQSARGWQKVWILPATPSQATLFQDIARALWWHLLITAIRSWGLVTILKCSEMALELHPQEKCMVYVIFHFKYFD